MSNPFSEDQIQAGLDQAEGAAPAAPAQPMPAAPQQAAPAPPEGTPAAAPAQQGAAPWAADLEGLGLGDLGPKVDAYLREKWQPRMTEYEGIAKKYNDFFQGNDEQAEIASSMLQAFMKDPEQAFYDLGAELGLIEGDGEEMSFDDGQQNQEQLGQEQYANLPPEYKQFLDEQIAEKKAASEQKILDDYLKTVGEEYGDEFDRDAYHKIFVGTLGKEDQAKALYNRLHYAGKVPAEPAPEAPAVLNESTGGPVHESPDAPKNIDDAMALYMKNQAALNKAR